MKGSRLVQKLIEATTPQQRTVLIGKLRGFVAPLATSKQNHVIQKVFEVMPNTTEAIQMIALEVSHDFMRLVRDKFGCRVVQRLVEHFSRARVGNDARLYVVASILQNVQELCADEYGHFAVETLLEFCDASERSIIVGALQTVCHGKASYVMKKVIDLKLLPQLQAPQSALHTSTECDDSDSDEEIAPPLGLSSSMKPGSFAPPGVFFKSGLDTDHCCSSGLVTIGLPPDSRSQALASLNRIKRAAVAQQSPTTMSCCHLRTNYSQPESA